MRTAAKLPDAKLPVVTGDQSSGRQTGEQYWPLVRTLVTCILEPLPTWRLATVLALAAAVCSLPRQARAQDPFAGAVAAAERGQLDSAYDLISRAAKAEPDSAPVQFWLGEIAAVKARSSGFSFGAFLAARRSRAGFAQAARLDPANLDYLQGLAEFLAQAPGITGGDRDSARAIAARLEALDPVRAAVVESDVLRAGGARERRGADSVIARLLGRYPADRLARSAAANYWALTGRLERAEALFVELVALDSTDASARFGLARVLVEERRDPRLAQRQLRFLLGHAALVVAQAATPGAPGRRFWFSPGGAWLALGQTWRQLGEADSARACYREALRLAPDLAPARAALDSLR